jgi:hypothetical protein
MAINMMYFFLKKENVYGAERPYGRYQRYRPFSISHHGTTLLSVQQRQFVYLVCLTCCQSLRLLS